MLWFTDAKSTRKHDRCIVKVEAAPYLQRPYNRSHFSFDINPFADGFQRDTLNALGHRLSRRQLQNEFESHNEELFPMQDDMHTEILLHWWRRNVPASPLLPHHTNFLWMLLEKCKTVVSPMRSSFSAFKQLWASEGSGMRVGSLLCLSGTCFFDSQGMRMQNLRFLWDVTNAGTPFRNRLHFPWLSELRRSSRSTRPTIICISNSKLELTETKANIKVAQYLPSALENFLTIAP